MKAEESEELWRVRVECHAGYRGDERPLRFEWGDKTHFITAVEDQWYGPNERYFRVRTSESEIYILRHSLTGDWTVESFRRE
jgi:hypothetical protein